MEIGKNIKALRLRRGLTQEEVAARVGVTGQAVSKWETAASTPDIALLPELSVCLGVNIDELFSLSDETKFERIENMCMLEGRLLGEVFEDAAGFLERRLVENPEDVRALTDLSYLYNHRAEYDHRYAATLAARAMELAPEDKRPWVAYLEAMEARFGDEWYDNNFEVIEFFKSFLKRHPGNYRGLYAIIENMLGDRRFDEAVPYIEKLRKTKDDYQAIMYLGDVEQGRGNIDTALRFWNQGVEKSPEKWQSWCDRADRLKKLGRINDALGDYERAFEIQTPPRLTDPLHSIAQLHELSGEYEEAAKVLERIVKCLREEYETPSAEEERLVREIERLRGMADGK